MFLAASAVGAFFLAGVFSVFAVFSCQGSDAGEPSASAGCDHWTFPAVVFGGPIAASLIPVGGLLLGHRLRRPGLPWLAWLATVALLIALSAWELALRS